MKALKVTISGSYKTSKGDIIDFEDISGVIPFVSEEHAKMHVMRRYASEWIRAKTNKDGEKVFKDRIEHMRQVFVDEIEETYYDFSYVGKDIKKMSYEELQDLATAKDLRTIPLPKAFSGLSLREMRVKAYLAYSEKVNKIVLNDNDPDFNFADLPELKAGESVRKEPVAKMTNDDIINQEQKSTSTASTKSTLTLDDLKKIADEKGIDYSKDIGFDSLHAQLFG